ncbi:MAG: hypothetical protein KAS22_11600 [Candidatus Heimdallarchaeota archaeon]|nr:hypothetical protein [Candidatus Heimdallarchaeota archaeon]MCK5185476.1 hypothetical protein [Candidatus Heimdallarchaeota archaeon]
MPKRKLVNEREKRKQAFQSENAPESSTPPSEDAPEQVVTPEAEGEALETEGETTEAIAEPTRDSLGVTKTKRKID